MFSKSKHKSEFGDFQTPESLCEDVCDLLIELGVSPQSIIEPTCGRGSFLKAARGVFSDGAEVLGFDCNPDYVKEAQRVPGVFVRCEDFFAKDWSGTIASLPEPILVLGNPPWVTNSEVSRQGGSNVPRKSSVKGLKGLAAVTGKSNFDISEWMLFHLFERLSGRRAVLAILCKTTVARKVLCRAWKEGFEIERASTFAIDAQQHFGVSVDGALLVGFLEPGSQSQECSVYGCLSKGAFQRSFALCDGDLVADLKLYEAYKHLRGASAVRWRSGVKHDAAKVMELRPLDNLDEYINGLGESVSLESSCLYPMMKSSEVMKLHSSPSRYMLITQKHTGEDISWIKTAAPKTWHYLEDHADILDRRSSSVYRRRQRFAVFGVGSYTFAPWKVAISGFYKKLQFRVVGPFGGKPVVFDDTCYFLPCISEGAAKKWLEVLNLESVQSFFRALIFWDSKRPITADILGKLDLEAALVGSAETLFWQEEGWSVRPYKRVVAGEGFEPPAFGL